VLSRTEWAADDLLDLRLRDKRTGCLGARLRGFRRVASVAVALDFQADVLGALFAERRTGDEVQRGSEGMHVRLELNKEADRLSNLGMDDAEERLKKA
jgi:hypothetical protein